MKANRKTMLGVALAVAIIALAGVGYAAYTGYKAETSSSGNTIGTEFNVVELTKADGTTPVYSGQSVNIEYNTLTGASGTTYQMKSTTAITMTFKIKITSTGVDVDNDLFRLDITGLSYPTVPGADVKWYFQETLIEDQAASHFVEGKKIGQLQGAELVMKIEPKQTTPGTNDYVGTAPAGASIPLTTTIGFTLTANETA